MQSLEVSFVVRLIYTPLGAKGLKGQLYSIVIFDILLAVTTCNSIMYSEMQFRVI